MLFTSYKQYMVIVVAWVVSSVNVITRVCWFTLIMGKTHTNKYCEHPITLIRDLLKRQHKHSLEKNILLFRWNQAMKIKVANLKSDQEMVMRNDLLRAAADLSYDMYKKIQTLSS